MSENFIVYNASAGSGKTYTLVLEYLALCLGNKNDRGGFQHVLAITFTKKATKEMSERIISSLKNIVDQNEKGLELAGLLAEKTGFSIPEIQIKSKATLEKILHNFGQLGVKTIDAFITQLIKPFANELNLPPDYEIELNQQEIEEQVVKNLIAKVGYDSHLTKTVTDWLQKKIRNQEKTNQLEKELCSFASQIFNSQNIHHIQKLKEKAKEHNLTEVLKDIEQQNKALEATLKTKAQKVVDLFEKNGVTDENLSYKSGSGFGIFKKAWLEGKLGVAGSRWTKLMESDLGPFAKTHKAQFAHIIEETIQLNQDIFEFIDANIASYKLHQAIISNLPFLHLAMALETEFDSYCQQLHVATLESLNLKIQELVGKNSALFIYERIGTRYRHILIDEFQDTSILQWHNLLPLVGNVLGEGGKIILVGDAKQAIYRWRGGESSQLVKLPEIYPNPQPEKNAEIQEAFKNAHVQKDLETNYRSTKNIIEFNNAFLLNFTQHLEKIYADFYVKGTQKVSRKEDGFLEIYFSEYYNDKEIDHLQNCKDYALQSVKTALEIGVAPKDITILLRKNNELSIYFELLSQNNILCYCEQTDALLEKPQVSLIRSLLKCLQGSNKTYYVIDILNQLHNIFPEKNLLETHWKHLFSIEKSTAVLNEKAFLNFIGVTSKADLEGKPILEWIPHFIQQFQLNEKDASLQQFLNFTQEFVANNGNWLAGFIQKMDEVESYLKSASSSGNAVQLMTIHKSKGLGMDTVIIPNLLWTKKPQSDPEWITTPENFSISKVFPSILFNLTKDNTVNTPFEPLLEEKQSMEFIDDTNLIYVAFTRAKNNLLIHCPLLPKTKKAESKSVYQELGYWMFDTFNPTKSKDFYYQKGNWEISELATTQENKTVVDLNWNDTKDKSKKLYPTENDAIARGERLHKVFAEFDAGTSFENWKAASKFARNLSELELEEAATLWEQMKNWFSSLNITDAYATYQEREFVFQKQLIRPDRIDDLNDCILVSDLKTGLPDEKHQIQVKNYLAATANYFKKPAKGVLLYTDSNQIIEVNAD